MYLTKSLLEKMPFPYFLINGNYEILSASLSEDDKWTGLLFTNFLASEEIGSFKVELNRNGYTVLKLKLGDRYLPHRIYLLEEEENRHHLFCFPLSIEDQEFKQTADRVEKKLLQFNLQLLEKKKYFEKTAKEIHEASLASDYMANVGQLAAGIAHEIRNPLTTVKGFIQLLKPYLKEIGKEQYAEIALEEINRANDIIYEFLNAAKPPEKKRTEISLNKLIKEMTILFESEAHLHNIDLSIQPSDFNPSVFGDNKQIKQVLVNILKNALEALQNVNRSDARIRLSAETKKAKAYIIVEDNGSGMSQETIDQLFVPFYTTKENGTGIGLSICKKIIEEHGGNIILYSQPGDGTVFKIELPLFSNKKNI
ncbi:signal transduction histidine kinase [Cytobacillus oceanisediminis]|jgi:signal transduction histidine kinase|uniref:histidine kinase n=1 Tax=Cytobacillus oceanisediminis TaxID=665099 RepID=A0A2V2ZTI0_9BACI|nr:ATP-binding protein [Cytobacillus oceanisediminis]PWW25782.1 signal transduction histidine kinase [Cytobacillus oceanisediminis]